MRVRAWAWANAPRVAIAAWCCAMLALGAGLLAKHLVTLPTPVLDQKLATSLSALRTPNARGRWLAVHVLYAECRCSQRIVSHLLATQRPAAFEEVVLWVGKGAPEPTLAQHYRVSRVTSADLTRLGIEAAPLLVVLDPTDRLRYAGGYSTSKQGPVLDDLRIFEDAAHSRTLLALPLFGCAVSEQLKQQISIVPGL